MLQPLLFVIVSAASYIHAYESECRAPDGGVGICTTVDNCPNIKIALEKIKTMSGSDHQLMTDSLKRRKSVCYDEQNDKYCCSHCFTPDKKSGIHKDILNCPHLLALIRQNESDSFVYQSWARNELNPFEFCCGPPPGQAQQPINDDCNALINTLPDPSSKCCGVDARNDARITGEQNTEINMYPWTVLLEYEAKDRITMNCGGAFISNKHVITSAYCIVDNKGVLKSVRAGHYDRTQRTVRDCKNLPDRTRRCTDVNTIIPIEEYIVHPGYNLNTLHNDIGLIRLKYRVRYTDFIRPICLPTYDVLKRTQHIEPHFHVAGWGKNPTQFRYKQTAKLNFVNLQTCQDIYKYRVWSNDYQLWEKQICAGDGTGTDSCYGDFGGSLMAMVGPPGQSYFELAGVTAAGPLPCGTPALPGLYTHVYHYIDWIRQKVGQQSWNNTDV